MRLKALIVTTVAFVIVSAVVGALLYSRLPDAIPTHFTLSATPDGFTAKSVGVFVTPTALALLGLFFIALPAIAPRRYRLDPFLRVYEIVAIAVLTVEFVDGMMALYLALGHRLDVDRAGAVGLGVLLLVIGNYLGKVTRNFFVGIRTPWTLASPEVWLRTHRVGGPSCVLGGAVILINSFAGGRASVVAIAVVAALALFLSGYSYILYRQIETHV